MQITVYPLVNTEVWQYAQIVQERWTLLSLYQLGRCPQYPAQIIPKQ